MVSCASAPLSREDALELLTLGELIARKAGYGRQLDVRAARAAGASWSQIGAAIGTSKQSAWEAHTRWIDGQAAAQQRRGEPDEDWVAGARDLAGPPGADGQGRGSFRCVDEKGFPRGKDAETFTDPT